MSVDKHSSSHSLFSSVCQECSNSLDVKAQLLRSTGTESGCLPPTPWLLWEICHCYRDFLQTRKRPCPLEVRSHSKNVGTLMRLKICHRLLQYCYVRSRSQVQNAVSDTKFVLMTFFPTSFAQNQRDYSFYCLKVRRILHAWQMPTEFNFLFSVPLRKSQST